MGQKIHPEGFRVGYIHDWKSNWFAEKEFADLLMQDLAIRDHIETKLAHAGLSDITIQRRGEVVEPDDARRQCSGEAAQDELARDVHPRRLGADQPLEPDLGERVEHDRSGRALGVGDQRVARLAVPEQQLVTGDLEGPVEDRLSCDEYLCHG